MSQEKAISLLRVSGIGQTDGEGPDRQRQLICHFAQNAGYHIVHEVFKETAQSGSVAVDDREDIFETLFECLERNVKVVLIEDSHRLSRDSIQSEIIIQEFQRSDIQIITAYGQDLTMGDATNPGAKMIRQLLAVIAEWEKDNTVKKLRMARDNKKRETNGREGREGTRRYGEKPGEDAIISVLEEFGHLGPTAVIRELNARDLTPRRGKWHRGSVSRMIRRVDASREAICS